MRSVVLAASRLAARGAAKLILQILHGWMYPKPTERYSHVLNGAKRRTVTIFDVESLNKRLQQEFLQG